MRIGIFGGSFDPVHTEHLAMAKSAVETLRLDRLFVMPAHTPPHKQGKKLTSDEDRLELCRAAFAGAERIEVSDYEIAAGGTSYTYLTCCRFRALYPSAELFWLVGTDMLRDFPTWKNPEKILENVTLAVCARAEEKGWEEREQKAFYDRFQKRFQTIAYEGKAVSSTVIRVLAAAGEPIGEYVPKAVEKRIEERGMYEVNGAKAALALEKPPRKAHTLRVAVLAAEKAAAWGVDEKKAVTAALFHDCAKNLPPDSPYLQGFTPPDGVPEPVMHQFSGAYVAEKCFGVTDPEILDAIRYHTSGRENMSDLEKLVFLADMLEESRDFEGVDELRRLFDGGRGAMNACMRAVLEATIGHLKKRGGEIYPLTLRAFEFMKNQGD